MMGVGTGAVVLHVGRSMADVRVTVTTPLLRCPVARLQAGRLLAAVSLGRRVEGSHSGRVRRS